MLLTPAYLAYGTDRMEVVTCLTFTATKEPENENSYPAGDTSTTKVLAYRSVRTVPAFLQNWLPVGNRSNESKFGLLLITDDPYYFNG
jgi:hypothetical protein